MSPGSTWTWLCCVVAVLVVLVVLMPSGDARPMPSGDARQADPMDVVGLALHATCVVRESVRGLNEHVRPRTIYIITKSDCDTLRTFASNVVCLLEDSVVPGLSKAGVAQHLEQRMKGIDADSIFKGRSLSGWYFQQLLKLGVSSHIDQLSSLFLLWDMDMIPVRPLTLFQKRGRAEQLPHKAVDADLHSSLHTQRALLQIGGIRSSSYELSYERLFDGSKVSYAPDGSSLVVHHMLVYKPIMHELIHRIGQLDVHTWRIQNDTSLSIRKRAVCSEAASVTGKRSGAKPAPSSCMPSWSTTILDSASERELTFGFSEYTTYASYALQKHPRLYATASTCTWRRTPYLYSLSARIVKYIFDARAPCCPTAAWLLVHRWLGFEFIGYEIGHQADVCRFDPQQPEYGL